ncbi:MAG: hypothetical protein KJ065_25735 [Anaerolineae bacterium]|nr:hypothetical protein [Anaerolineae bacterium]
MISPEIGISAGTLFEVNWDALTNQITAAMSLENDPYDQEVGVVARGSVKAAELLVKKYNLVITNVPYLGRSRQSDFLMDYLDDFYPVSKNELGYVFLERFIDNLRANSGVIALVQPQNFLYMPRYKPLRKLLLQTDTWHYVARLGTSAFETISGEVVNVGLFILSGAYADDDHIVNGIDVGELDSAEEKAEGLHKQPQQCVLQQKLLESKDHVFSFGSVSHSEELLESYVACYQGLRTGDANRFVRFVWEIPQRTWQWDLFQSSSSSEKGFFSGYTNILFWENARGQLHRYAAETRSKLHDMHESGNRSWGKYGVAIGQITLRATAYFGHKYDNPIAVITPDKPEHLGSLYCFLQDDQYYASVKEINRGLYVTNAALIKIPFDLEHWQAVAQERYPNGFPSPYSDDPTQWIFHGHPCGSVVWDEDAKALAHGDLRTDDTVLQVTVARLLGYRWPAELDEEMELSAESREWVARSGELLEYADKDGIVCIPSVRGERPAADRLLNLLVAAYSDAWSNDVLGQLLASADHAGKTLETWLRDKFFSQHCALFNQRPFIWHIWDGLRDGFSVLVNYHKLDYKLLETLIYNYLGDWITHQKQDIHQGADGAQEKLAAAEALQKRLILILKGEAPYDIFVRWKPLEEQPMGWNPDLNDGVRLNIRPFMSVPDIGKKGAGVLRDKPRIDWGKDRGKDVESAPWYATFKGERINDHHLSLAEKQAAPTRSMREQT